MLIKCSSCGTPVSDKAVKCPKCGALLKQEVKPAVENDGILKVFNKASVMCAKYPDYEVNVSVYPDEFAIDPLIEVVMALKGSAESKSNKKVSDFENILMTNFSQYEIRKDVLVTELVGDTSECFTLYKDRPEQMYKAEWGKPYSFVLYENNKPAAVVMLGDGHSHDSEVKYLISRMYCKKINIPYINFYTQFPNTTGYVISRINQFLELGSSCCISIQINNEDLKKMNLVSSVEALPYYAEFYSDQSTGKQLLCIDVEDASFAARIISDILVNVFKKKIKPARFVVSILDDDENSAKYNSDGEFLDGRGYGQGEFAYYEPSESVREESYVQSGASDIPEDSSDSGVSSIIWWIIGGIIGFIWFLI